MKISSKNIAASIVLLVLLTIFMAHIFQARWLVILDVFFIVLLMFFLSWQIGIKKKSNFLANDFGQTWGNFVAIILLLGAICLFIWIIYVCIYKIPLKY